MTSHRPGAGKLDRRITIQRSTAGVSPFNAEILTWDDFITVSAERRDFSEGERFATEARAAGQVGSQIIARFRVRSSTLTRTITARDRISHDGAIWNIKIAPYETLDGRRRFIWITAARDAD